MDKIDFKLPVIITEGHPDAMAVSTVYKNVVSVPSGIKNLDWIENCWNFINKVEKFIIWADNDNKTGIEGAEEIRVRIGKNKCVVDYHFKHKDANELLIKEGERALKEFVDDMMAPRIDGLINMGRRRGTKTGIEKFRTGFKDIDSHLSGLEYGCFTVIFGRDNEGKSTFISQMIAEILKDQKVFLYSGELTDYKVEDWIMSQIVSGDEKHSFEYFDEFGEKTIGIKESAKRAIYKWYQDRFFLYEIDSSVSSTSKIFDVMESAFKIYGVRVFFVDNIMSALDISTSNSVVEETAFVKRMKAFALDYNVHIFMVAHPNKSGSVEHVQLQKVDVNGAKAITSIADYIFAVERSWNPENESLNEMYRMPVVGVQNKYYTSIVRILKNRVKRPRIDLFYRFHGSSLRFYNDTVEQKFAGKWQNHLIQEPKTIKLISGEIQTLNNGELG
jgi:twinkle protein